MSLEQDLLNLKTKGEQLNTLKIQNATKLESLEKEKNELLIEAQNLGVDPARIEETLVLEEAAVQQEINALHEQLEKLLNDIQAV